jgi:lipoprotein-anchoring transpeptidase ErfK/SrfK
MNDTSRLLIQSAAEAGLARLSLAFAAPAAEDSAECASAWLALPDGSIQPLGQVCAPTIITWHAEHHLDLGLFPAGAAGAITLHWGDRAIPAQPDAHPDHLPTLVRFEAVPHEQSGAVVHIQVSDLGQEQRLRLDGGAGQVYWIEGNAGSAQTAAWALDYVKPGTYPVAADVVAADGFWLATLAATAAHIAAVEVEAGAAATVSEAVELAAPSEVPPAAASNPPWLPFRYARPLWAWSRMLTQPGGSQVSRSLAAGTYLAIDQETVVNGALWYRSTRGDWIAAAAVALMQPSELRGVELGAPGEPPPPPPPPPDPLKRGIVTAALLNVRRGPGVRADNPPIDQLPNGAEVRIYEEQSIEGAVWYRIGVERWVHGGYVRIVDDATPPPPATRRGIVTAAVLNVRAQPGVMPDNPVIDQLRAGTEVTIYGEQTVGGAVWYQIGANRWVHSAWVRPLLGVAAALAAAAAVNLPVGWVVSSALNVRAEPGGSANNPVIDQVMHNQRLDILETRTASGERWYRIGDSRWVLGQWVAVASAKPRPASISASELWVGVNLSQQTAVAYQGDRPVYAAMVATGLPATPTVRGVFRTWKRLPSGKMSGGSTATGGYYYLEEVTWTCYFYSGYALHTAYWHDAFGRPRSHGCVNFSPYDAWWIYQWSAAGGAHSPVVYVYTS